ncbi:MAG TPA: hypothetical protein VF086_22120 [Propionibacteriaceae bacterium]
MNFSGMPLEFGPPHPDTAFSRRSRQAVAQAIDVWAESIKRLANQPEFTDEGADLEEAINNAFAFAERLLEAQRELTLNLVRTLLSDEEPVDPAG